MLLESFCTVFPVDFHLLVLKIKTVTMDPGTCKPKACGYSFCVSGCSETVTLGVFGCCPPVGEFMFRFFSFPVAFFFCLCLLNVEVFHLVYLVWETLELQSVLLWRAKHPQLLWAQTKGHSLCKGRKISFPKSLHNWTLWTFALLNCGSRKQTKALHIKEMKGLGRIGQSEASFWCYELHFKDPARGMLAQLWIVENNNRSFCFSWGSSEVIGFFCM